MAEGQLERIDVIFVMPAGNSRDYDTRIELEVTNGSVEAARNDNVAPGLTFRDPGTYGPFPIPVTTPFREQDYLESTTKLTFVAPRKERWITDVILYARFSHGVTYNSHSGVVVFDENADTIEFRNLGAVRMLRVANRAKS